ncbi:MAG TPA: response regulator transcription factor [Anaerolineae bacterium]|nr:response regulator transcription factor [Anaerolineae bacterium]
MAVRILLADDHPVLRAGLRALIEAEPDLEVVGEAEDGDEAVRLAELLAPDVAVLDISMPGLSGIEATRRMIANQPGLRVLVLTVSEEASLLQAAVDAGARGYIVKRVAEVELMQAVRAIIRGDFYVHTSVTPNTPSVAPAPEGQASAPTETLTAREVDVLRLIALGYTNPEIAQKLQIGVRTVESHRANLMDKLDRRSRVDLVLYAYQNGLFEPEQP